ncbi:uncharacterized protein EDB91DRAFT_1085209 [Suillus paluster]|uniref:uncharacterized protein n=1 Tax=Suillus paluster TaxID=48578 RepID=UPI001B8843B7|nr:uncharacterized protein EDB91DRAFT_1085209 [Suillus paluster]KAG1731097.1 hypothetical protein EDB91DRAFT_1085209 [Suillus paluster]
MPTCSSCQHMFTKNGYSQHLAQSKNPKCVTIYEQMQNYVPSGQNQHESSPPSLMAAEEQHSSEAVYEHNSQNICLDKNPPVNVFDGNYFNTQAGDLEWPEETNNDDLELEEEDIEAEGAVAEQERDWEPPVIEHLIEDNLDTPSTDEADQNHVHYSDSEDPESAYHCYHQQLNDNAADPGDSGIWAPVTSQFDYKVVHWEKMWGPGSTSFSNLKYSLQALYRDPELHYLIFVPERHYTDQDETQRLYHDLHTGTWWWKMQTQLKKEKPSATVIPILLSSDKTQVTMFQNKLPTQYT